MVITTQRAIALFLLAGAFALAVCLASCEGPADRLLADTRGNKMTRQIVYTNKAPKPPATYSQAVKAAGLIFVSGTSPHNPLTGEINATTIQGQTRQCLATLRQSLRKPEAPWIRS